MKLKGRGTASPGCTSILEKSMLSLSSRAGVPVCNRPSWKPALRREPERPTEGASSMRPAGKRFMPADNSSTIDRDGYITYAGCLTNVYLSAKEGTSAYDDLGALDDFPGVYARLRTCAPLQHRMYVPSFTPSTFPQLPEGPSGEWLMTRSNTLAARMSRLRYACKASCMCFLYSFRSI